MRRSVFGSRQPQAYTTFVFVFFTCAVLCAPCLPGLACFSHRVTTRHFSYLPCLRFVAGRRLFLSARRRPPPPPPELCRYTVALSPSFSFPPLHLAPLCSSSVFDCVATPAMAFAARTEFELGGEAEGLHGNVRDKHSRPSFSKLCPAR